IYIYIHVTYIKLYSVSIIYTDIPGTPVITRSTSEVVENRILTMTCSARSTTILPNNLPSDLKPIMEYRWQRDNKNLTNDDRHQMSDKTVTIDKIQRQDNKITYRCIAQESGSRLSNYKDINMFTTSNIVLDTVLCEGNFYQTWKGKLTQNKSAPLQIVIKKTKGINKYVLLFVHFINRSFLSFKIRNIYKINLILVK
ncbi:hypothetical protein LSH36_1505g00004, partial [Paralvinella palmiformis]